MLFYTSLSNDRIAVFLSFAPLYSVSPMWVPIQAIERAHTHDLNISQHQNIFARQLHIYILVDKNCVWAHRVTIDPRSSRATPYHLSTHCEFHLCVNKFWLVERSVLWCLPPPSWVHIDSLIIHYRRPWKHFILKICKLKFMNVLFCQSYWIFKINYRNIQFQYVKIIVTSQQRHFFPFT